MNNARWEATQRGMAAKLTRLTEKVTIQWHQMAESCNICSLLSYRSLGELDTPLYECIHSDWQLLTWGELPLRSGGQTFVLYYSSVLTDLICFRVEMLCWNIHTYVIRRVTLEKRSLKCLGGSRRAITAFRIKSIQVIFICVVFVCLSNYVRPYVTVLVFPRMSRFPNPELMKSV
jgi:hypothetical protein